MAVVVPTFAIALGAVTLYVEPFAPHCPLAIDVICVPVVIGHEALTGLQPMTSPSHKRERADRRALQRQEAVVAGSRR